MRWLRLRLESSGQPFARGLPSLAEEMRALRNQLTLRLAVVLNSCYCSSEALHMGPESVEVGGSSVGLKPASRCHLLLSQGVILRTSSRCSWTNSQSQLIVVQPWPLLVFLRRHALDFLSHSRACLRLLPCSEQRSHPSSCAASHTAAPLH